MHIIHNGGVRTHSNTVSPVKHWIKIEPASWTLARYWFNTSPWSHALWWSTCQLNTTVQVCDIWLWLWLLTVIFNFGKNIGWVSQRTVQRLESFDTVNLLARLKIALDKQLIADLWQLNIKKTHFLISSFSENDKSKDEAWFKKILLNSE